MITHRTNLHSDRAGCSPERTPPPSATHPHATAADRFTDMERQHERGKRSPAHIGNGAATPAAEERAGGGHRTGTDGGDIIYGAKAIAWFLFGEDGNRACRRVFNLWAHYRARKEKAGFFKLKGALCLSKTLWRRFHGLG